MKILVTINENLLVLMKCMVYGFKRKTDILHNSMKIKVKKKSNIK